MDQARPDVALGPYVPRLAAEWLRDMPERKHLRRDGSLVFCDLSGFTAMSEKLAGLGRLGAEELSDIINRIFGALLADAAAFGGSMLKYGGDAILVFFWGGDHERRAVAATARMRSTLRTVGRVRTSQGPVRVRMSCGVHSGRFDFFLVGSVHRELVVAGPESSLTCALETAADAGEILLSPATAAALPPACVGTAKGPGLLLARRPRQGSFDPDTWANPVDEIDPAALVPVALRAHLETGASDPEHRHATVAFVAFGGLDALLQADDSVAATAAVETVVSTVQEAADRYGVSFLSSDVYADGGKVILTAGVPSSFEDNDERVLRAVRDVMDAGVPSPLHIGVERGYVFAGDVGPPFRRAYTLLGDAVNTAARVMASCGPAVEARVTPPVLERAGSRFHTERRPPFAAKGKAEPIVTVALGDRIGPKVEQAQVPFTGRETELAALQAALDAAATAGGAVRVTGPAGVGKSRLVGEAVGRLSRAGEQYRWLRADPFSRETPHATVAPLLTGPAGADLAAALDGVAALVIDDAHHLDDASVDTLDAYAAGWEPGRTVLVIVDRGGVDRPSVPAERTVAVQPLALADAVRVARAADPELLSGEATRMAEQAAGNVMFLVEMLAARQHGLELADSVENAVAARIDDLDPDQRDLLRTAAVLGESFAADDLREVAGLGRRPDLGGLRAFVAVAGDTVTFRQALFRDVAYAGLTFRRRRVLHAAAGRLVEATAPDPEIHAEVLGRHFFEAHDWERAWRYSMVAGRRAYATTYKAIAAAHLGRAVNAGAKAGVPHFQLAEVAKDWGLALYFAGRPAAALSAYRRARRWARAGSGDPVTEAAVHAGTGLVHLDGGDLVRAGRCFRQALSALEGQPADAGASTRVSCLAGLLAIARAKRRPRNVDALVAQAMAAAEHGDASDRARALGLVASAAALRGEHRAAAEAAEREAAEYEALGLNGALAEALVGAGAWYETSGWPAEAARTLRRAAAAAERAGNELTVLLATANLAATEVTRGRYDEAARLLDETIPVAARTHPALHAFVLIERAHVLLLTDRAEEADGPARRAAELVATEATELTADLAALDAHQALVAGRPADASIAAARASGADWSLLPALIVAARAATDGAAARREAERLAADERAGPVTAAAALVVLGRSADAELRLAQAGVEQLPAWVRPI